MRDLKDLATSADGVQFLAAHDIFFDHGAFVGQLHPPVQAAFTESFGAKEQKPVYALQQIYIDCTQSMLGRMAILQRFEPREDCFPFFLWIDTDLAGTDALMLRFFWPVFGKKASVRFSAGSNDSLELRCIPVELPRVQQALDTLETYLSQSITGRKKVTRAKARDRYDQLKAVFLHQSNGVISELNHRVAYFLLNRQAGLNPFSILVSDLLTRDLLTAEISLYLTHIEDAIRVFNATVEALRVQDIDPKVKPLAADYLPLHFSCLDCSRRLRLRHAVEAGDHFAVASCKCQQQYRFHLGRQQLSIEAIAHAGAWSPDVSLTMFMNDFVSGYIGGGSSGIYYGLVMKEVLDKVFDKRRVPILLPPPANVKDDDAETFDSLLYRYLMDHTG